MVSSEFVIRPQRVNRGGNLGPEEVVGRDRFIDSLWDTLARQGVVLTAERRMGKTSVLKKMRAEPREGVIAIYRSYEGVRSRQEFIEALLEDLRSLLSKRHRAAHRLAKVAEDFKFRLDAGPIHLSAPPAEGWKNLLLRTFEAVGGADAGTIALFWDEVPVMLGAIAEAEGPQAARELLDALRVVRQSHDNIRMVFTGSLGLHHVVAGIRPGSYSSAPTNDMRAMALDGLAPQDAVGLARNLFAGEQIQTGDPEAVAAAIAGATSYIPFYIQNLVGELCNGVGDVPVTVGRVGAIVDAALVDPIDPWEFRQYRDRIGAYYRDREEVALAVLDAASVAGRPLTLAELHNLVKSRLAVGADEVREVLVLLQLDHYLSHSAAGYSFAFEIVARSWRAMRDLS